MMVMTNFILDKTDRGREEIATRKYGLASRLRSLLVMVDGKKSNQELLNKVSGLGLGDSSLVELVEREFIEQIDGKVIEVEATPVLLPPLLEKGQEGTGILLVQNDVLSVAGIQRLTKLEKSMALKKFFNETIKAMLGLRGFSLQLKVERAGTVEELRNLRQSYYDAILKVKGAEMACSMLLRLDQILEMEEI